MATTISKAEKALEAARASVTEWTDKAAAARAEAAELDANSGALILADPTAADDIAVKIHAADMRARSYDGAAAEARKHLETAGRDLLEAHAADYDRQATRARKARDEHDAKVDALLAQLKELDGREFAPVDRPVALYGSRGLYPTELVHRAFLHSANAAAFIRFYLATGKHPTTVVHLRSQGGIGNGMASVAELVDGTPPVFAQLATIGADPEFDAPAADEDGIDSELDPVEDADLIRLGAR